MNEQELTRIYKAMSDNLLDGEKTAVKFLFGIKYAEEWKYISNESKKRIAENATGKSSAATEINKGAMLAKYVKINRDTEASINNISTSET